MDSSVSNLYFNLNVLSCHFIVCDKVYVKCKVLKMSNEYIAILLSVRKEIGRYIGIPVWVASIIGELLSIIVLLSLKTFRESSGGFYLIGMSTFNFIRQSLSTNFILISMTFGMDYSISIVFFCRIRNMINTICNMSSVSCLCMAVIDQYFATCTRPQWQQWSNIRLAHRITAIITIIWIVNGIFYAVYVDAVLPTNTALCASTNAKFLQYHAYGHLLIFNNVVPLIPLIFGLMPYRNVRNIAHRTVPLVRCELEKQLTVMILVQMLVYACTYLPFAIVTTILAIYPNNNPFYLAAMNLANAITFIISIYSHGVRILIVQVSVYFFITSF